MKPLRNKQIINAALLLISILTFSLPTLAKKSSDTKAFPISQTCKKAGKIPDDTDPRIYYSCTKNDQGAYDIQTHMCPASETFDPKTEKCTADEYEGGDKPVDEFQCLKDNVATDAERVCFEETVNILEKDVDNLVDLTAWRGSPSKNFMLSVRELNLNMRKHYRNLIENVAKNIFPLIIATDNDTPELSGIGGAYKVYFRNGTLRRIVPDSKNYELHKSMGHLVLGIHSILAPYFKAGPSVSWRGPLTEYGGKVNDALALLPTSGLPDKEMKHCKDMLNKVKDFVQDLLKEPIYNVTAEKFKTFAHKMNPLIDKSMQLSAKAQITSTLPVMKKLKAEMGADWKKAYVIIPTIWPVSSFNVRLQVFRRLMDFKQIRQQVIMVEGAGSEDAARTVLGRIVADRAVANLVWGGQEEESSKDSLFSLSTRRDLVSTVAENALDRFCGGEDDWEVLTKRTASRCPMEKAFATMLRQG